MSIVSVIGATTWGITVSRLLANKGEQVSVWTRTDARAQELGKSQQKSPLLPHSITFTSSVAEALQNTEFIIWAVPAQTLRQTIDKIKDAVTEGMIHVSLAKGLEADTCKLMSEVILDEIPISTQKQVCVLSGPNLSQEINRGLPATSVLAGHDKDTAEKARQLFNSPNFAVFVSDDIVGVELCGALKNIIAIGAGMVDGLGLGDNAKATLITLGWAEVTSLGSAMGARPTTFYGLAGMGDLIATCAGPQSRNHYIGREVASGRSLAEVKAAMSNIAEGIDTTMATHHLAEKLGLQVPIIDLIYSVLFEAMPPIEITNRFKKGLNPEAIV